MARYWILIFSWFGVASPQYINTAGPAAESVIDASIHYPPLPYVNYLNLIRNDEAIQNEAQLGHNPFFAQDNEQTEVQRKRRTAEGILNDVKDRHWSPNQIDKDKTISHHTEDRSGPFIIGLASATDDNSTEILSSVEKRSFSPWGGKRSDIERMWTWKRSPNIREPTMPKRVRFSPWGGKRSGQMIYKPESKSSKIIFSAIPELTRIISNYPPDERYNIAGVQFTPMENKRNPVKVLPLYSQMDENNKDATYKSFLDTLPKFFRPGQTYANIYLKKDGKRKLKFSAWGGKRSPPIIGPIWAPTSQDIKDAALDTIVYIRNNQDDSQKTT